jgi:hypothetical protein
MGGPIDEWTDRRMGEPAERTESHLQQALFQQLPRAQPRSLAQERSISEAAILIKSIGILSPPQLPPDLANPEFSITS